MSLIAAKVGNFKKWSQNFHRINTIELVEPLGQPANLKSLSHFGQEEGLKLVL